MPVTCHCGEPSMGHKFNPSLCMTHLLDVVKNPPRSKTACLGDGDTCPYEGALYAGGRWCGKGTHKPGGHWSQNC